MTKWLQIHSDHIKLCLKQEQKRNTHRLQDLRCWLIQPQNSTSGESDKSTRIKVKPKKQITLRNYFQTHPNNKKKSNTKVPRTHETKMKKTLLTPSPLKYIQTILKLRKVKPEIGPHHTHATTYTKTQGRKNSPNQDNSSIIPVSIHTPPTIQHKVSINRLVKKYEHWRDKSPRNIRVHTTDRKKETTKKAILSVKQNSHTL